MLDRETPEILLESRAIMRANEIARKGDFDPALSRLYSSADVDQIVREIVWSETASMRLLDAGLTTGLNASNLFFSRSGFSSLFMAWNPSFVGEVDLFEAAGERIDRVPFGYVSDIDSPDLRRTVIEDIRAYVLLHVEL